MTTVHLPIVAIAHRRVRGATTHLRSSGVQSPVWNVHGPLLRREAPQWAESVSDNPPSTGSIAPVTYDEASDKSHATASATSSVVPTLPRGIADPVFGPHFRVLLPDCPNKSR